jgi:hypothetical protein
MQKWSDLCVCMFVSKLHKFLVPSVSSPLYGSFTCAHYVISDYQSLTEHPFV